MKALKITPADVAESAKIRDLGMTQSDAKSMPGYWEKPAKVMRTGVGLVDGYEWGVSFKPNEDGKLTKTAAQIGEAMAPSMRAATERQYRQSGQYPSGRPKGDLTMTTGPGGALWKRVNDEWVRIA